MLVMNIFKLKIKKLVLFINKRRLNMISVLMNLLKVNH